MEKVRKILNRSTNDHTHNHFPPSALLRQPTRKNQAVMEDQAVMKPGPLTAVTKTKRNSKTKTTKKKRKTTLTTTTKRVRRRTLDFVMPRGSSKPSILFGYHSPSWSLFAYLPLADIVLLFATCRAARHRQTTSNTIWQAPLRAVGLPVAAPLRKTFPASHVRAPTAAPKAAIAAIKAAFKPSAPFYTESRLTVTKIDGKLADLNQLLAAENAKIADEEARLKRRKEHRKWIEKQIQDTTATYPRVLLHEQAKAYAKSLNAKAKKERETRKAAKAAKEAAKAPPPPPPIAPPPIPIIDPTTGFFDPADDIFLSPLPQDIIDLTL